MINNYDSVVACASTATPHSQKQEGTSYTATKRNWLSFVTVFVALFSFVFVQGQTTLISPTGDGGFENGSTFDANGWTNSSSANNPWVIGTAVSSAPIAGNSAYISNNGVANAYTDINTCSNFFWRNITVPAGETAITLSFNWICQGESTFDNWQVFYAPTTVIPTGSTTYPGSGATNVPAGITGATWLGNGNLQGTVQTATIYLPASLAGTTFRLIFHWKNDSGGTQPPASIDNISLISRAPGTFTSIVTGNWNSPSTWDANAVPTSVDNAIVSTGHTVTADLVTTSCNNLTVNGTLAYATACTNLAVAGNLTVASTGLVNVFTTTTGKILTVAGNISNDGRIDLSVSTSTSTTTQGNLTLNGSNVQTVSGSGTFGGTNSTTTSTNSVGVIRHLVLANTNSSFPNINWNVNNVRLMNGIVVNSNNKINLNTNKLYFGNFGSFSPGTVTVNNSGSGFYNGSISRWWTTGQSGTGITPGTDPTNSTSRFPFINNLGQSRALYISRSSTTSAGNTAGYTTVIYNDVAGITTGLNIADTPYSITDRSNGNWTISTENGYVYASGTHTLVGFYTDGFFVTSNTSARLMNQNAVVGAFQNGSLTPAAQRTGLSTANLTANSFYIGTNTADIPYVSIANGDWNATTTWNKGTLPTCTDLVTIAAGTNVTVNSNANVSKGISIASGGTLTVSSGDVTVGCTLNNNTLTNNGTLTVSGGALNVNGNITNSSTSIFNQSGGAINIDGNAGGNATNSVASGTAILQFNQLNSGINLTGGTLTIVDPHANTTSSNSIGFSNATPGIQTSTAGHTLRFGDGISTDAGGNVNGFRVDPWTTSAFLSFGNIIINGSTGTNRSVTCAYQLAATGDVTVTTGSTLNLTSSLVAAGNVSVNSGGTFINLGGVAAALIASNTGSNLTFGPSTSAQTIGGSGTYQNLATSPTANLTNLNINNTNATGVTLSVPLSVSGTLTMTSGLINTTSTNLLTLGTSTAAGILVGTPSATNMIVGPFARTFATRTAAGTYDNTTLYPVGKGTVYTPVFVDPTIAAASAATIRGEAFATNSGSGSVDVTDLSATRWEVLTTNGFANLTNTNLRVSESGILSSYDLVQAPTAAGVYDRLFSGTSAFAAGPILTGTGINAAALTNAGYFAYGTVAAIQPPTITGYTTAFSSVAPIALCSNGGPVVTITGTNLGTVTSVLFNSISGVDLPGTITAKTATTVTVIAPSGVVDGVIKVINPAGNVDSTTSFTVVLPPTITASAGTSTICSGTSTTLTGSGGATYSWSPATGLSATTGTTVTASPTVNTTYTVTGVSAEGCSSTSTVTVTVSPAPSAIIIAPPAAICSGGTATLSSSGGNVVGSGTAILGTGTLAPTATSYPNPFSAYYGGVKHQMLYTATELQTQGLVAGPITQLKFDLSTFAANACTDLTIRMGTTSNTALTTFVTGTSTVYGPTTFTPSATGIITFTLTTPFVWNGTSNLIVEIVNNAGNGGNGSGTTNKYTTTATNTVFYGASDTVAGGIAGFDALTAWGTSGASANRPNTQFVGAKLVPGSIIWSPLPDLYTDAAATTAYTGTAAAVVYAKLTAPATYTATSTLGSCSVSTPVTVTPNALPTITLDATTPVCNGGTSSSLSYTATTGTPTQYTIDFDTAAELAGFADVLSYTTLTLPISLVVPAGAAPGTYTGTITVKNATTGCESATPQTFTVVINTPVAITTQPSNSVSLVNSNASFTVVASGSGLTYQWQESTDGGLNWNNISAATSATYTAVSVSNAMTGNQYKCIVSGAAPCTSVTSNVVTLTISTTAITTQPASTAICSNGSATFTIATTGTPPTYQWQISTNSGTSWSDISGETNTTLTVSGLTSANSLQQYRCVLSPGPINSDAAILTVNDIVAITTQPADVTVCSNAANATFTTVATGTGLTYQWQQRANSSGTWANVGTGTTGGTTATLTISTLSTSLDGYQYQCIVTGTAPCVGQTTTTATLSVTGYTLANSTTGDKICIGGSVTFTATPTTSSPALTYSWECATAGSGATTPVTGSVATITPTQVGSYTYTLTATGGTCSFTSTQTIVVNVLPVITTATANPTVACAGSTINLAATIVNIGAGSAASIGNATTLTTATTQPTAFCNRWPSYRMQMLFTAAELQASGLTAGNITSMAFRINSLGDGATNSGFILKLGSTASTALTTFEATTSYTTVFPSQTYTHTASGLQTINFATPYNWDGVSNIVVDMVHNGADATNNSETYYTATTNNSVAYTATNSTNAASLSTNRPNIVFGGQVSVNNSANYTWSWSDGSATVLSTASGTATLPAGATTTYTVTATNPATGCFASQNVTVSTAVSALALTGVTPATSNICVGSSVTLIAAPTGGCIPYTYSWSDGTSVVGTSASITVSPTSTKTYTVTVVDNTGTATVNASSTITVNNPQPASVVNQTICAASSAFTLSAVASGTGNLLNWYAGSTGGSVLASGATFTTPSLSAATTTYYVEENALGTATTGLGRVSTTSVTNTTPSTYGLVFDLNAKSKLNSVDVYLASTTAGNLVVQLQNSAGTVINSKTIAVPAGNATTPVQYTVPLDFIIPAGTGYRLLAISGTAMVRESALGGFPYSLGAFGNITGGYLAGASTTYYYFYNWSLSDVCTGIRVPVTATLNAPPVVTLGSPSATICSGQSTAAIALTSDPSSFTGYTWLPATGVSGTSAAGWTFNPTTTTTYTLNATDGTCSNTATFTVNVNPSPSAMTITPAAPAVCVDAVQALTVSGGLLSSSYSTIENFDGTTLPAGWVAFSPTTTSEVIISTTALSGGTANELGLSFANATTAENGTYYATMPVINASSLSSLQLNFKYLLSNYSATTYPYVFKVQTSTNNLTWTDAFTFTPTGSTTYTAQNQNVSLTGLQGVSTAYVRFAVIGNVYGCNYVVIDNVSVTGNQSTQSTITWSPDTNLYTNAAATTPYTLGTNATTVYVKSASAATTTYTAKATAAVTNCETTATVDVIVNPNNTVSTASTTPTVCINTAITDITHTTTGATGIATTTTNYGLPAGVTANWSANTITISGTPTAAGTFNYTIPLGGGCGTFSATGTITVTANNTASTASSTPTVCINTAIIDITHATIGATNIGAPTGLPAGVTANWSADTITISGTPSASGTFNYDIPLTGGCGTVSATGTITVSAINTASVASSTPTVCINTAITAITHTTTGATGFATTTTNYGLPAGVTAVLASNTITISGTPTASGTFNYDIPLTGGCGTVSATGTITVTPLPGWFNTQFPSSASICEGGSAVIYGQVYLAGITDPAGQASGMTAQLGYSSSNTDPNTWTNWINASFNVQTVNNDEFLANIGSSLGVGTYFYAFRYSYNGCTYVYGGLNGPWNGTTSNSGTLTINALPVATITRAGDDLTATETGATYQWYNCTSGSVGALISGATTQSYTATATGSYAVEVTKNGCSEMSACFDVATLSGNSFDLAKLSYYPNPVIDVLTISYTNEITAVQVYDISGRLVRDMKPNSNEVTVDLSDLAASVYVVKVFADTTSGEFKVVKK
jgi:hypothetical protein